MKRLVIASMLISTFAVVAPIQAEPHLCEVKGSKQLSGKERKDKESWVRVSGRDDKEKSTIYVPANCEAGDIINFNLNKENPYKWDWKSRALQICSFESLRAQVKQGVFYAIWFNCIYRGEDKILKMR